MAYALTAPTVEDHASLLNFEQLARTLGGGAPGQVLTADAYGNASWVALPTNYVVVALSHSFAAQASVSASFAHSLGVTPSVVLAIVVSSAFVAYEWTAASSTTFTITCFTTTNTNITATVTGSALVVR